MKSLYVCHSMDEHKRPFLLDLPDCLQLKLFSRSLFLGRLVCKNMYETMWNYGNSGKTLYIRLKIARSDQIRTTSTDEIATELAFLQRFSSIVVLIPGKYFCRLHRNLGWRKIVHIVQRNSFCEHCRRFDSRGSRPRMFRARFSREITLVRDCSAGEELSTATRDSSSFSFIPGHKA